MGDPRIPNRRRPNFPVPQLRHLPPSRKFLLGVLLFGPPIAVLIATLVFGPIALLVAFALVLLIMILSSL